MKRKKILYLITKSNWGGAQRYVYDLATNLSINEYEVTVALGGNGELARKLTTANIKVHYIQALQRDISLFSELRALSEIGSLIRQTKPDVFHINSSKAGGLGAFLGRLLGVPNVIFTAHGWAFNEDRPGWQKLIITYLHWLTVFLTHHTIAVSDKVKQQLPGPFVQSKMTVVHNGRAAVSYLDRSEARDKLAAKVPGLSADKTTTWTGTIGELHPVKQHNVMINAVAKLVAAGQPVQHLIIGAGELESTLQKQIERLNLTAHVFLLGHIDEAARYLKALDVYVQPSRSEAFAYTVIEAVQAGLPVVASRVGGIPEIITHEQNGLLVPTGDADTLSEAIITLLNNPETAERYAVVAAATGQEFDIESMVHKTSALY